MSDYFPEISIIVPVYNVQSYIRQCLDSLVNQTFTNIKIICVNDGSSDNCLSILNEYAERDNRILVINQENRGVAEARNIAIQTVQSEYIMFADGDDWLEPNTCEILIDTMQLYQPDVVMFSYFREYKNASLKKNIFDQDVIVFEEEQCKKLHRRHAGIIDEELAQPESADALCSLCTKLFKTSIIKENGIKYIDNKIIGNYGDGLFNLFYFKYIKKAVFINKHLYHYRKTNPNSIVTAFKEDFPKRWNNMFDIIENYIQENSLDGCFTKGLSNRIALSIIGLGLNELSSNKNISEKYREISDIMNKPRFSAAVQQLETRHMPWHWKVFFTCAKLNFTGGILLLLYAIKNLKERV